MRSRFVLGVAMVAASLWTARCASEPVGSGSGRAAADAGSGVGSAAGSGGSTMHTLSVDISGPGGANGRVGSRPDGIACGSSCSAQLANGTEIELTATPGQGSVFGAWEGGICSGTPPTCKLRLTTDAHVTAVFQHAAQECAGLGPAEVSAPSASVQMSNRKFPIAATSDGAGVVGLISLFGEDASLVQLPMRFDLYDSSGTSLGGFGASSLQVTAQLTDFIVRYPTGAPGQLAAIEGHAKVIASTGPGAAIYQAAENPLGGVIAVREVDGQQTVIWFDAALKVRWSYSLPKGVGAVAFAADREGNTLVVATQLPGTKAYGFWIDRDGNSGDAFDLGTSPEDLVVAPRVGNGVFLGTRYGQWISQFDPFGGPKPAPGWLTSRRSGTLRMARNGRAYAVIAPRVDNATGPCSTAIEIIAPSGKSCGWAVFASPAEQHFLCESTMWIGYDGTAIQQTAPRAGMTPMRWWTGFFR